MRPLRSPSGLQAYHAVDPERATRRARHLSVSRLPPGRQATSPQLGTNQPGRRNLVAEIVLIRLIACSNELSDVRYEILGLGPGSYTVGVLVVTTPSRR